MRLGSCWMLFWTYELVTTMLVLREWEESEEEPSVLEEEEEEGAGAGG